jgi:hypothetical protein
MEDRMAPSGKDDRRRVTLGIPTNLYEELERYSGYLNLRVNDAVELAIANMVSQAKALGADWPLARPWMDSEFATWLEARDEFLRERGGDDE